MWPTPASRAVARRRAPVMSLAARRGSCPRSMRAQARDRVDQLALAVAVDAGDARRSRRARTCSDTPSTAGRPRSSVTWRSSTSSSGSPRRARPPSRRAGRRRGRPSCAPATASSAPGGVDRADALAAPQHGDAVGDVEHLVQLVGDEDDGRARPRSARRRTLDELGRLLRGQHRRRLVEHEDPRAAVQRAQDLDALLLADGDVLDRARRGRRQPVALGQLAGAPRAALTSSSPPLRGSAPSTRFSATVMTGMSMKCWNTMPMPWSIASRGEPTVDRLAVDEDLALVRREHPVDDVHQRRLARAVLAEQRVDLATPQLEVDARRWPSGRRSAW